MRFAVLDTIGTTNSGSAIGTSGRAAQAHARIIEDDPIVACLVEAARRFGKPATVSALADGLPIDARGQIERRVIADAALRIDLDALEVQRRPSRLSRLELPALLFLANGGAALLVGRPSAKKAEIFLPGSGRLNVDVSALDDEATGDAILLKTRAEPLSAAASIDPASHSHWFWGPVRRGWRHWSQIALAAFLLNIIGLAVPLFALHVYDRVIPNGALPTLWVLSAGVALAIGFEFLLRQLRTVVLDDVGRRIDRRVGATLFANVLGQPLSARRQSTGLLANQLREFDTVRDVFTSSALVAVTDLIFMGAALALLWWLVGPVALIPLGAIALVIVIALLLQIPLKRITRNAQASGARRHGILVEALSATATIKAAGGEGQMQRRYEDALDQSTRQAARARFWSSLGFNTTAFIQQVAGIATIIWGVILAMEGALSVGGVVAASMLVGRILAPLASIAQTIGRTEHARAAYRDLKTLMATPPERRAVLESAAAVKSGAVTLDKAAFTYPGARLPALDGASFKITAGERIGLIGRVGSGKSTIGKLIAGLYRPASGTILLDGLDAQQFEPAEIRRAVGYLAQDADLFAGTIRDNI
ncbi:MAG: hypothetical protein RL291_1993, partial [Pseudomonadota bacterium]